MKSKNGAIKVRGICSALSVGVAMGALATVVVPAKAQGFPTITLCSFCHEYSPGTTMCSSTLCFGTTVCSGQYCTYAQVVRACCGPCPDAQEWADTCDEIAGN